MVPIVSLRTQLLWCRFILLCILVAFRDTVYCSIHSNCQNFNKKILIQIFVKQESFMNVLIEKLLFLCQGPFQEKACIGNFKQLQYDVVVLAFLIAKTRDQASENSWVLEFGLMLLSLICILVLGMSGINFLFIRNQCTQVFTRKFQLEACLCYH